MMINEKVFGTKGKREQTIKTQDIKNQIYGLLTILSMKRVEVPHVQVTC